MNFTFSNPLPTDWDPTDQLAHWMNLGSDFTLPPGHINYQGPTRDSWTLEQSSQRGNTHWSRFHVGNEKGGEAAFRIAFPNNEYNDVPRIREIFNLSKQGADNIIPDGMGGWYNTAWWPNGPFNQQQAEQKANEADIRAHLWIGETMEGEDYFNEGHPMWGWFYARLKQRYEARKAQDNLPYYICHNYYTRFGSQYNLGEESRAYQEGLYNPANTLPSHLNFDGSLSHCNLLVHALYNNIPDFQAKYIHDCLFKMDMTRKWGKHTGIFWFNVHEWFPGHQYRIELPDGEFGRSQKAAIDPNIMLLFPVLAHEFGTLSIPWGVPVKASMDKTRIYDPEHWGGNRDKDFFYPTSGGETKYSNYQTSNTYPTEPPMFACDLNNFGLRYWNSHGGQTVLTTTASTGSMGVIGLKKRPTDLNPLPATTSSGVW